MGGWGRGEGQRGEGKASSKGFYEKPNMIDRGVRKNQYIGDCLKMGAWTVCRFKGEGGLARKKGWVFFEGD